MHTDYRRLTDEQIKRVVRTIIKDSSDDENIRSRLKAELGYPYTAAIASYREIVRDHGGLIRKGCAMVMIMMHGPRGNTISI